MAVSIRKLFATALDFPSFNISVCNSGNSLLIRIRQPQKIWQNIFRNDAETESLSNLNAWLLNPVATKRRFNLLDSKYMYYMYRYCIFRLLRLDKPTNCYFAHSIHLTRVEIISESENSLR